MEYKIVCWFCSGHTYIGSYENPEEVERDIDKGLIRCWVCTRKGHYHSYFDLLERENSQWKPVKYFSKAWS